MTTSSVQEREGLNATQVEQLRRAVGDERTPASYRYENTGGQEQRLWDVVEQAWTKPFPLASIGTYYLRKMSSLCTACGFTSHGDNGVERHVRAVFERSQAHKDARLNPVTMDGGRTAYVCTGCNNVFDARKNQGQKHIAAILEGAPMHRTAKEQLILRYALGPSAPTVLREKTFADAVPEQDIGPVAEVGRKRRKRRRSRNRARGRVRT